MKDLELNWCFVTIDTEDSSVLLFKSCLKFNNRDLIYEIEKFEWSNTVLIFLKINYGYFVTIDIQDSSVLLFGSCL